MPLPSTDFDPTESGVPWQALTERGVDVVFATPDGKPGSADALTLHGQRFGPWKRILEADRCGRQTYQAMSNSAAFAEPLSYADLSSEMFDGAVLPGGHARGMRPYIESTELHAIVRELIRAEKPVGAICHGVLVLSRCMDGDRSVIHGRRMTALTALLELSGWWMTRLWLGDHYRTYPQTVEAEVRQALGPQGSFERGPLPLMRDSPDRLDRGFSVVDGNIVTARWPGDSHRFAASFCDLLEGSST